MNGIIDESEHKLKYNSHSQFPYLLNFVVSMNKIIMLQTCLCNISSKEATRFFMTASHYREHLAIIQH